MTEYEGPKTADLPPLVGVQGAARILGKLGPNIYNTRGLPEPHRYDEDPAADKKTGKVAWVREEVEWLRDHPIPLERVSRSAKREGQGGT